ncbi:acetylcholinesterase-like isoform X1 [Pomacea canaliculata]|uniref:acetylcholinesterase-like isoform X1 n=1 Tax=Pomacea canaliculata TaxID=400727 RepID=UPI000D728CD0|nr:acetylcholinesterase-like isoform X1 [Pomacea canaliculata]
MNLTDAEAAIMQQALTYFPRGAQQATTALLQEYLLGANYTTNLQIAQGVNQICSDLYFNYPMLKESLLSASVPGAARQYVYQFSYLSPRLGFPEWAGVPHTAEIPFVSGLPFDGTKNWTDKDKQVSSDMMDMWTNFAKHGRAHRLLHRDPTPLNSVLDPTPLDSDGVVWLPYTPAVQAYLRFETKPSLSSHLNRNKMEFLGSLFEQYGQ